MCFMNVQGDVLSYWHISFWDTTKTTIRALLAQSVARMTLNHKVRGSSPLQGFLFNFLRVWDISNYGFYATLAWIMILKHAIRFKWARVSSLPYWRSKKSGEFWGQLLGLHSWWRQYTDNYYDSIIWWGSTIG